MSASHQSRHSLVVLRGYSASASHHLFLILRAWTPGRGDPVLWITLSSALDLECICVSPALATTFCELPLPGSSGDARIDWPRPGILRAPATSRLCTRWFCEPQPPPLRQGTPLLEGFATISTRYPSVCDSFASISYHSAANPRAFPRFCDHQHPVAWRSWADVSHK